MDQTKDKNKKVDDKKMPFIDHLEELRWVLIKSIASVIIFSIVSYVFSEKLVDFLTAPYPFTLIALGPTDIFMLRINLSLTSGIMFSLPVILYQFWKFIAPGLYEKEKSFVPWIIFFTILCFVAGALFAYYLILRTSLNFLAQFQTSKVVMSVSIDKYISFVALLLIGFGLSFELPVVSVLLAKIGLLTSDFMKRIRGYAIVVIFIVAAIITPDVLGVSQVAMAVPLVIMYEISIWLTKIFAKKSEEEEEEFEKESEKSVKEEEKKQDEDSGDVYGDEYN